MRNTIFILFLGLTTCNYTSPDVSFEQTHTLLEQSFVKRFSLPMTEQGVIKAYPFLPSLSDSVSNNIFLDDALLYYFEMETQDIAIKSTCDSMMKVIIKQIENKDFSRREMESNPLAYDVFDSFSTILKDERLTPSMRLKHIDIKLNQLEQYLYLAKQQIIKPDLEKVNKAIETLPRTYYFFVDELPAQVEQAPNLPLRIRLRLSQKIDSAKWRIKDYLAFCNSLKHELEQQQRMAQVKKVLVLD